MNSKFRLVLFVATIAFVGIVGFAVSYFARGYRLTQTGIKPTGILVVTSSPDGAQIIVNGQLESATNATITLPPETYDIEIKKEGFLAWKKRLAIKKEEVTKVDTTLFPAAPSLSPVTFSGAINPIVSPDGAKVVFGIEANSQDEPGKVGLWVLDLGNLPIGFSSDPRRVTNINPANSTWFWSPEGRDIVLITPNGTFILPSQEYNPDKALINVAGLKLEKILDQWELVETKKQEGLIGNLPESMQDLFLRKTQRVVFSPDQKKVLYKASGDFLLPDKTIPEIPGASTQKQERDIKNGQTYVYDIKEDRNFLISETEVVLGFQPFKLIQKESKGRLIAGSWQLAAGKPVILWFPNSLNLTLSESEKITIMDYDSTNRQVVFSGPYVAPYAYPYPNGQRLLLLTHFGAGENNLTNLYSLGLK